MRFPVGSLNFLLALMLNYLARGLLASSTYLASLDLLTKSAALAFIALVSNLRNLFFKGISFILFVLRAALSPKINLADSLTSLSYSSAL
jgi:hypothetical protein